MTSLRTIGVWRLLAVLAVAALVTAACSSSVSPETPAAPSPTAQGPSPTPTAPPPTAPPPATPEPTRTPDPTATPSPPTATPQPTAAAIPIEGRFMASVLTGGTGIQEAYTGPDLVFEVSGFQPLEMVSIVFNGPGLFFPQTVMARADTQGVARWSRSSAGDPIGLWTVVAEGDLGSQHVLRYVLADLALPVTRVRQGETDCNVYHIPESKLHYDAGIPGAMVALISQFYREALATISQSLDFEVAEPIDFFLLPDTASLRRELEAGGASGGSGFEAGVSLYNFPRSSIYLDMSIPEYVGYAHIVAHEFVHQITGRIEGNRRAPSWFIEGIAEYYGHQVGLELVGEAELPWRRLTRGTARRAAEAGTWIDLASVSGYEVWQGERSLSRLERIYSESYAVADYIAATWGDQAIRPLLEALAERPEELDAVFMELLAVTFADLQEQAKAFVVAKDAYETEIDAAVAYAQEMFDVLDGAEIVRGEWNEYVASRSQLSEEERLSRAQMLLRAYRGLQVEVEAARPPDSAAETHAVFLQTFPFFIRAGEAVVELESGGGLESLDEANGALDQGNRYVQASRDLLIRYLGERQVGIAEVFRRAGPARSGRRPRTIDLAVGDAWFG